MRSSGKCWSLGARRFQNSLHSHEPLVPLMLPLSLHERRQQPERADWVGLGAEMDFRSCIGPLESQDRCRSYRPEEGLELDLPVGLDRNKASRGLPRPAEHLL